MALPKLKHELYIYYTYIKRKKKHAYASKDMFHILIWNVECRKDWEAEKKTKETDREKNSLNTTLLIDVWGDTVDKVFTEF